MAGAGKARRYYWRVRKRIPLLSPAQVARLPTGLQAAHHRLLRRWGVMGEGPWPSPGEGLARPKKDKVKSRRRKQVEIDMTANSERIQRDRRNEVCLDPLQETWKAALSRLRGQMPAASFALTMGSARLISLEGGVARIAATPFAREQIRRRGYMGMIREALAKVMGKEVVLEWAIADRATFDYGTNKRL